MEKLLLSLFFFAYLLNSYAQENNNFGLQFDINGIHLNNYCDLDYSPDKILKIIFNVGEKYAPGTYYDLNNKRHVGYIKIDPMTHQFLYKIKSSDEITLNPEECLYLTILKDSFVVIKNFEIEKTFGKSTIKNDVFAEVIAKTKDYTIYKHTRFNISDNPTDTYIINADTSNHLVSLFNKSLLIKYFGHFEVLKSQIQNGHFKIEDLSAISKIYEYKRIYDNHEKIFYSLSWDEIEDSMKATYYSKIVMLKDTIWELKFYNHKNEALYSGHFSAFSPTIKDGEFMWYFTNGNIRKKLIYKNNVISGNITENYESGNHHYTYKFKRNKIIYDKIFSIEGKEMLNEKGNCIENVFDSIKSRKIVKTFEDHKLLYCTFINDSGKLIILKCKDDAKLNSLNFLQRRIDKNVQYPIKSLFNYNQGIILVSFLIDNTGNIINYKIIKGLDDSCNEIVNDIITSNKFKISWDPAKIGDQLFNQEIIVPFYFEINGLHYYSHNNNYNFMWQQQQWNRFPQPKMNIPSRPVYNFH